MDVSRYVQTDSAEYDLEFVSPAFLGGADGNAELRAAAFKAMLRFWWRAVYGAKYGDKIYERESEIFGSTDWASGVRIVLLAENIQSDNSEERFVDKGKKFIASHNGKLFPLNILDYLAYGKNEYSKEKHGTVYTKTSIKEGGKFKLKLACPKSSVEEIRNAFAAFVRFGGIGGKSRNGFGSLHCDALSSAARILQNDAPLKFSAFSKDSRLYVTKNTFPTWDKALGEIGVIYRKARLNLEQSHCFEKRGLVARPIEAKFEKIPFDIKNSRHPKFVFLHVTKEKGGYRGQLLTLPICFYEEKNQINYENMVQEFYIFLDSCGEIKRENIAGGSK